MPRFASTPERRDENINVNKYFISSSGDRTHNHDFTVTRFTHDWLQKKCVLILRFLHFQACISGNKLLVERLIAKGHPVNIRDNAGWLPLHEACIHGHTEIVNILVNSGANINDRGGVNCDGEEKHIYFLYFWVFLLDLVYES